MLANWLFFLLDYPGYVSLLERAISPDGRIERPVFAICGLSAAFLLMAAALVLMPSPASFLASVSLPNKIGYGIAGILIVAFFSFHQSNAKSPYCEDGFFETLSVVLAALASICLLATVRPLEGRRVAAAKIVLATALVFFAMEEISWGQRLFVWKTPEALARLNTQRETNLHNFFTPWFSPLYLVFDLGLGLFLFWSGRIATAVRTWPQTADIAPLIPSSEFQLYGVVFVGLAPQSVFMGGELSEEIFAVFALAYAWSQFFAARAAPPRPDPRRIETQPGCFFACL